MSNSEPLKDRYDLYNDASMKVLLKDTNIFKDKGEEYIKSLIICSDTKDKNIHKRPLSKLIKDISEELGLTNSRDYKGKQ
ncbi:MAG: hypothetical protein Q9M36_08400 [Sulfurovum sp.]|nr:hypothetical protein [Sulfurovum sp.]